MRILFDTNVLIAALIARGNCYELFEHCVQKYKIVSSDFIFQECADKLIKKFRFSQKMTSEAIALLKEKLETVNPQPLTKRVCRDPSDDHILAAAVYGQCDCLITGDKDLLVLKKYSHIPILSPSEFWKFEAEKGNI